MDRAIAFAILEISAEATPEEVRAAYRRRAFATHPDRAGGDAAAFQAVSDAYRCLSDAAFESAQEPGPASEADTSTRVPPTNAARVLFEYLSDLASEMILNGATPETVVSFLAREGCPESVARALERDLRVRVQPATSAPPATPEGAEPPAVAPSAARRPRRSFPGWRAVTLAAAAVAACVLGASFVASPARSSARSAELAPPAATAVAPARVAPAPVAPAPVAPAALGAPAPAPPPRSAPAPPGVQQSPRPAARARQAASRRPMSAELDAERAALEADQRRFAAEAAELDAESRRIDAAEAALASSSDVERYAVLTPRKAAYNARVEIARRTEKSLQRRVHDLNAKITAYNERVRSGP